MDYSGAAWWIEVGSEMVPLDGGWYWLEPLTIEHGVDLPTHAIRLIIDAGLAPESWLQLVSQRLDQPSQLCCQLRSKTAQTPVRRLNGRLAPSSMVFATGEHLLEEAVEQA